MKRLNCLLFALILTIGVNAQTIKKYSGQMSKPEWIADLIYKYDSYGHSGYYSYYEDANENRIIHGKFEISYKTYLLEDLRSRYVIKGEYRDGERVGEWEIKKQYSNGEYAKNIYYRFNYKDGLLDGPFAFFSPALRDLEVKGHFSKGVVAGKVVIIKHLDPLSGDGYTQIEGEVNAKGLPHGIWTEKEVWKNSIPKDITRLYYDGNLVYRRVKDLSSGKIEYTFAISDEIRVPADSVKISDTIIDSKDFVKIGTAYYPKDTNQNVSASLYNLITDDREMMTSIYPSIVNWRTAFDKKGMQEHKRKMEEEQRRLEEQTREKRLREERLLKEKAAEEERIRREQQRAAELKAKGLLEWEKYQSYYISIFDDSVNFMNHLEAGDWENYAKNVIEDEYDGLVYDLSNDIVDRSAKGYKKGMDTLQVSYVFSSLSNYNSARKLGRERVTKDIISYANNIEMAQKAERKAIQKEKNKKIWKTVRNVTMGVALVAVVVVLKYMDSASAN